MGAQGLPAAADRVVGERQRMGVVRLMREVRFSIDRDWAAAAHGAEGFEKALPITNSWGGWPSAVGITPYLVLRIVVSGVADPVTGFLVNIHQLDKLLRLRAIPMTAKRLLRSGVGLTGEALLRGIWSEVSLGIPGSCGLESLQLWTTPFLSYAIRRRRGTEKGFSVQLSEGEEPSPQPSPSKGEGEEPSPQPSPWEGEGDGDDSMVELTQCFEFSASHRLHVAAMSDVDNLAYFGKCNNPRGHGHNYQVEVTVARDVPDETGTVLPLPKFEAVVKREVIDRLDHKHLNGDVQEFSELNPTVENIAKTIWTFLEGKLSPAELLKVRVWETAKTYAEVSGGSVNSE